MRGSVTAIQAGHHPIVMSNSQNFRNVNQLHPYHNCTALHTIQLLSMQY